MKAILTLHDLGEKVKVVSVPNTFVKDGLECWEEEPPCQGCTKRLFGTVDMNHDYYDVEITDDTPTESIKQ